MELKVIRPRELVMAGKHNEPVYLKSDVDSLIAKQASENRRLERALYRACANWAFLAQWERGELVENWEKWENVERECRKKVEGYK